MIIKESFSIPEVGPFYIIDGVVFTDSDPVTELSYHSGKYKDSNNSHYEYWKILQRIYPEFRTIDYDFYPRGRVVYNKDDDKFYLYLDKCIQDRKSIFNVMSELNLPIRKTEVKDDEHYQCHNCNPEYVGVAENYDPNYKGIMRCHE